MWRNRSRYGNVSVLPTSVFFYGMEPRPGSQRRSRARQDLIVRFVAVSEPHDDGTRTVFFELNGQPRSVHVQRSHAGREASAAPKSRNRECRHTSRAPMPGTSRQSPSKAGQKVTRGEVLLTLEAMKMETSVRAERDGEVSEVLARPGLQVDAKDLLLVLG